MALKKRKLEEILSISGEVAKVISYADYFARRPLFSSLQIKNEGEEIPTGRKKVGAMLGDFVEVGCNSVLCPGSIICKNSTVYPTSCVRGVVAENSIYKKDGVIVKKI